MRISTSKENSTYIIRVDGKIDSITSKDFQDAMITSILDGETKILIDCAELEYISSSGIRAFYYALRELSDKDGVIALSKPNDNILRILEMVDFQSEFPIYDTVDKAIEEIQK